MTDAQIVFIPAKMIEANELRVCICSWYLSKIVCINRYRPSWRY